MNYEWREVPCKCGFTHENNPSEFETYHLRMGSIMGKELPLKSVPRCKTCKNISILERPCYSCKMYKSDLNASVSNTCPECKEEYKKELFN